MEPILLTEPPAGIAPRSSAALGLDFKLVDDNSAVLEIYGEIGSGGAGEVGPSYVAQLIRKNPNRDILVKISSPGGSAFDGIAIHNALLQHQIDGRQVTVRIEGLAGSAASVIAMAGSPIEIFPSGTVFIHRASATVQGNCDDLQHGLDWLTRLDSQLVDLYVSRTGLPKSKIESMLVGEVDGTAMNALDALELGFVDTVLESGSTALPRRVAASMHAEFSEVWLAERRRERRNALYLPVR